MNETEQVAEPTTRIVVRPTVQFGLDLQSPVTLTRRPTAPITTSTSGADPVALDLAMVAAPLRVQGCTAVLRGARTRHPVARAGKPMTAQVHRPRAVIGLPVPPPRPTGWGWCLPTCRPTRCQGSGSSFTLATSWVGLTKRSAAASRTNIIVM